MSAGMPSPGSSANGLAGLFGLTGLDQEVEGLACRLGLALSAAFLFELLR